MLLTPSERFKYISERKISTLVSSNLEFRAVCSDFKYSNYNIHSSIGAFYIKKNPLRMNVSAKSTRHLEIEVIDLPDNHNPGIIFQIACLDTKSNNRLGEIGVTVYLSELE